MEREFRTMASKNLDAEEEKEPIKKESVWSKWFSSNKVNADSGALEEVAEEVKDDELLIEEEKFEATKEEDRNQVSDEVAESLARQNNQLPELKDNNRVADEVADSLARQNNQVTDEIQ